MGTKATVADQHWLLERTNDEGFPERIVYTGKLRDKPKGWKVIRAA